MRGAAGTSEGTELAAGVTAQFAGLSPRALLEGTPNIQGTPGRVLPQLITPERGLTEAVRGNLVTPELAATFIGVRQAVGRVPGDVLGFLLEQAAAPAVSGRPTIGTLIAEMVLPGVPLIPGADFQRTPETDERIASVARGIDGWIIQQASNIRDSAVVRETPPAAHLIAATIVSDQAQGRDTSALEETLELVAGPERASVLLDSARTFADFRGTIGEDELFGEAATAAARFTYESSEKVGEVRRRIEAGESAESVVQEFQNDLTNAERSRDFINKMIFDPLNVLDAVPVGQIILNSRAGRAAANIPGVQYLGQLGGASAARLVRFASNNVEAMFGRTAGDLSQILESGVSGLITRRGKLRSTVLRELTEGGLNSLFQQAQNLAASPEAMNIIKRTTGDPLKAAIMMATDPSVIDDWAKFAPEGADVGKILLSDFEFGGQVGSRSETAAGQYLQQTLANLNTNNFVGAIDDAIVASDNVTSGFATITPAPLARAAEAAKALVTSGYTDAKAALRSEASQLLEDALASQAKALDLMDDALLAAADVADPGKVTRALSATVEAAQRAQGYFAVLHMTLNPGWFFRNKYIDNMILTIDGVNVISHNRTVAQRAAELQLLSPGLFRGTTGKADVPLPRVAGVGALQQVDETRRGMKAFLNAWERFMNDQWKEGQAIRPEIVNAARNILGPKFEPFEAIVRSMRTGDDIGKLSAYARGGRRTLTNTDTVQELQHIRVLQEVEDILAQDLDSLDEVEDALRQLFTDFDERATELARTAPAPGSLEANLGDEMTSEAREFFDEEQSSWITDAFNDILNDYLNARDRSSALSQSYVHGLPTSAESDVFQRRLFNNESFLKENYPQAEADEIRRIWHGDLWQDESVMAAASPEAREIFEGTLSRSDGWFRYNVARNNLYQRYMQTYVTENISIAEDVLAFLRQDASHLPSVESYFPTVAARQDQLVNAQRKMYVFTQLGEHNSNLRIKGATKQAMLSMFSPEVTPIRAEGLNSFKKALRKADPELDELFGAMKFNEFETWLNEMDRDKFELIQGALSAPPGEALPFTPLAGRMSRTYEKLNPGQALMGQARDYERLIPQIMDDLRRVEGTERVFTTSELRAIKKLERELRPVMATARDLASQVGTNVRDFSLFNYGDRYIWDQAFSLATNYSFWYTRNTSHFAMRAFQNPGSVAALIKLRLFLRSFNRDLPEYFQDQVSMNILGTDLMFPAMSLIDPMNGIFGDKFYDQDLRQTGLGEFINDASQFGPGPHSLINVAMAGHAAIVRKEPEEAETWVSYLGPPTRAVRSLTVKLKDAGLDFLNPGGYGLEPWMYEDGGEHMRFLGSKWDERRIYKELFAMVEAKDISLEDAFLAGQRREGDIWDQALQQSASRTATTQLLSFFLGNGLRGRTLNDVELQQMDMRYQQFKLIRDQLGPEDTRQFWRDYRSDFSSADIVLMGRRDEGQRLETLTWSVLNRLPPGTREFTEAFGLGEEFDELLSQFFDTQLDGMTERQIQELSGFTIGMATILAFPVDWQQDEWDLAREKRSVLNIGLQTKYGDDVFVLQSEYYDLNVIEQAQFLEDNATLELMWDAKNQIIMSDPLLAKYYSSMDMADRMLHDEIDAQIKAAFPDNEGFWDDWRPINEQDHNAGSQYKRDHPTMVEELEMRSAFDREWSDRLGEYGDTYANLQEQFPALRADFDQLLADGVVEPRDVNVASLIESQSLGRFDLPENLDARQLKADIREEIDAIPDGSFGQVTRELDERGNLDRRLDAFFEAGNNLAAIEASEIEFRALLVAFEEIRLDGGWDLEGTQVEASTLAPAGGGSGGRRRRSGGGGRRSSSRGGAVATQQAVAQAQATIGEFLGTLRGTNPLYWRLLVQMAGMTDEQRRELLGAQGIAFAEWLAQATSTFPLSAIYSYFNTPQPQRAPARRSGSQTQRTLTSGGV